MYVYVLVCVYRDFSLILMAWHFGLERGNPSKLKKGKAKSHSSVTW